MPEAQTLIIGGGIAGAATAFYLARLSGNVALVERGEIASEASGVNAGQIGATGWGDVPDLGAYLTMGSLQLFKEMQLDLGYDIEFRQSGALTAIHTPEQYDYMRERVLAQRSRGHQVELLTPREARSIEPEINPGLLGYMYTPLRAQADPVKATRAFAQAAASAGARILTDHAVTGVEPTPDGGYAVATSRGEFRCRSLVIAAGAWCAPVGEMLGLRIPNRASSRADVGYRESPAQRLPDDVLGRVGSRVERGRRLGRFAKNAAGAHPSRQRARDTAPVRSTATQRRDHLRRRPPARGL